MVKQSGRLLPNTKATLLIQTAVAEQADIDGLTFSS